MSERQQSTYRKLAYTNSAVALMIRLDQEKIHYISEHPIQTDILTPSGFEKVFKIDIFIPMTVFKRFEDGNGGIIYPSGLCIEVDGKVHLKHEKKDLRRTAWLEEHGYTVLRFTNEMIKKRLNGVIEEIREATKK